LAFNRFQHLFRAHIVGYLVAIASVAAVSLCIAIAVQRFDDTNLSILYLVAVLFAAVRYGLGPASLASVLSVWAYNYFFVYPVFGIELNSLGDFLEVLIFLMTGVVTSQLAAGQRRRAEQAEKREREAVLLYDVMHAVAEQGWEERCSLSPTACATRCTFLP
jgi:two-component system sensor histidine kinase KdpD